MIAEELLHLAKTRGIMLATAESCTAGLLAGAITEVAGSSAIFDRGFVTYTNAAKTELLGVKVETLAAFGAVSEEVALEMANGALSRSDASIALSITGIAGPGGSEHKPEGRVCFAIATEGSSEAQTIEFGAIGRAEVRAASVQHALTLMVSFASKF